MRFRSVFILFFITSLFWTPSIFAQKRVYAKVDPNAAAVSNSADIYDPTTSSIAPLTGRMNVPREAYVAVMLRDGRILIAGGYNGYYLNSAEIFDPATGLFVVVQSTTYDSTAGKYKTATGTMSSARGMATAVLLQSGRVLIAGGFNGNYLSTAELFDPSTGTFTTTSGSMVAARQNATATLLSDGKVLLSGGFNSSFLNTAEIYDPAAGTFKATTGTMTSAREGHTSTLLSNGKVLVVGGHNNSNTSITGVSDINAADIYDPATGQFSATGAMTTPRSGHTATLLSDGRLLIAGGTNNGTSLNSAEIYDPASGKFSATGAMATARTGHAAAVLGNGKVLAAGGYSNQYLASAEIFDPTRGVFTPVSTSMTAPRYQFQAQILNNGKVLLAGGQNSRLLTFDTNLDPSDNISPNMVFSPDSKVGFVPYTGSGVVVAYSVQTGQVLKQIQTGGYPAFITPLRDGKTLAVVSVLDNKIFLLGIDTLTLKGTYSFSGATFGFGSFLTLSPDGTRGYISSTGTGEVLKFDAATGTESGRLKGLQTPAQITVTPDGSTLLVVDTSASQLEFVDSSAMTIKYEMKPRTNHAAASFTIFNKAVLGPDGSTGVIGSQDTGTDATSSNTLFVFKTSTGEILDTQAIGYLPGFTALTPDGQYWVVLNQFSISVVPRTDPASTQDVATVQGNIMGSSNIVFSPDSRYAYYASSAADLLFQHDLGTKGVLAQVQVGDDPNVSLDEASSVAITPDGKTVAVLNFMSNEVDLLTDVTVLTQTKFVSSGNQFTGLTVVNLSDTTTNLTLTLLNDTGYPIAATDTVNPDLVNPISLQLGPNAQMSAVLSQLFSLDIGQQNVGRVVVTADQPAVAAFATLGEIRPTWFGAYLSRMDGLPLSNQQVHDWIVPEVVNASGTSVELNFVNPNYNGSMWDLIRFSTDGSVVDIRTGNGAPGNSRQTQEISQIISQPQQNRILIAGGADSTAAKNTAETYDASAQSFTATTTAMARPRQGHTATLLQDGKVLVGGGKTGTTFLNSAEIWNPLTGSFSSTTGTMLRDRYRHTATRLPDGTVLLAGGQNSASVNDTAEIYDVSTNAFSPTTGKMTFPRDGHSATLLPGGEVLVAGGIDGNTVTASAELYNPASSLFGATNSMAVPRVFHTATAFPNGRVLIAGGYNGTYLNSAEIYDPSTARFTATANMTSARSNHACTWLLDGTMLITGGTSGSNTLSSAEIYDPASGLFIPTASTMTQARSYHTATLLADGKVLIAGGTDGTTPADTAEVYDPVAQSFTKISTNMTSARQGHTATFLEAGGPGYFRVGSLVGLMFTEFFNEGKSGSALSGIDMNKYVGVTRIYSPQFAIVPSFKTTLNLINGNTESGAQVILTLHDPNGRILGKPVTRSLNKNAQLKDDLANIFQNDPAIQHTTGWLEIQSSVDRIAGTLSFTNPGGTLLAPFELSGQPLTHFLFPLAPEDSVYQTALALLNSDTQNANVQIELWGAKGSIVRSTAIVLPAGTRTALYLSDYFPGLPPQLVGNIRIRSDQPLHSLSIVNDRSFNFLCAVPPIPFP